MLYTFFSFAGGVMMGGGSGEGLFGVASICFPFGRLRSPSTCLFFILVAAEDALCKNSYSLILRKRWKTETGLSAVATLNNQE